MESNEHFLSKNIIKLRNGLKLTQSELAERADVSLRGLQDIEYNKIKSPRSTTLFKIAKALGVDVIDLYNEKSRPSSKSDSIAFIVSGLSALDERELSTMVSIVSRALARSSSSTES